MSLVVPRVVATVGLVCCLQSSVAVQPADVAAAVARYATGDATGVRAVSGQHLSVSQLTSALDAWVAMAEPASRDDRATTSVMFALEVVWASTRSWVNTVRTNRDPHGHVTPSDADHVGIQFFVAQGLVGTWAARRLPRTGTVSERERIAWLATIGVMEDGHAWHDVLEVLPVAALRLPDEPRLRLAQVVARTNIDLGALRVSSTVRPDLLTDENLPSGATRHIPDAIKLFESVADVPALSGEVMLRTAYLEIRRRRWPDALSRLDRAIPSLSEPALLATAHYFTGWIQEQLGKPDDAIAAYRRAHAITPDVRNLSTSLAALLYMRNARDEAYSILDRAFNAANPPDDLLYMLEHGDARFVPAHFRTARAGLR
jgi:hypothetical protein